MNPPFGGISFIVSMTIILIGSLFRFAKYYNAIPNVDTSIFRRTFFRQSLSFTIIGVVATVNLIVLISTMYQVVFVSKNNYTPLLLASPHSTVCTPLENRTTSEKMIVLRLDDVQSYGWHDISMRMMTDALERKLPVVAGVIPKESASNPDLNEFFARNGCNLEVALHGYDHQRTDATTYQPDYYNAEGAHFAEFASLTTTEAHARIARGLAEISGLSSQEVLTFIPPEHMLSPEAELALHRFGIHLISGGSGAFYDYHAYTWDGSTDTYVSATTVMNTCWERFDAGENLCVIMLHPQDYARDDGSLHTERYTDYLKLLNLITISDTSVVTFKEVTQNRTLWQPAVERYATLTSKSVME
jgi:hypothetical protein